MESGKQITNILGKSSSYVVKGEITLLWGRVKGWWGSWKKKQSFKELQFKGNERVHHLFWMGEETSHQQRKNLRMRLRIGFCSSQAGPIWRQQWKGLGQLGREMKGVSKGCGSQWQGTQSNMGEAFLIYTVPKDVWWADWNNRPQYPKRS